MRAFEGCAAVIVCVVAFFSLCAVGLGLTWVAQGNDFFLYKFWAPKMENVRREVFENTKSYNEGMKQELQNMEFEYERTADLNAKEAMASVILHRVSEFDETKLPADLRAFISDLRHKRSEKH